MIIYSQETNQFHLSNKYLSYIMELVHDEYLIQVYYGEKVFKFMQKNVYPQKDRSSFSPNPNGWENRNFSLDVVLQEIPGYDVGDYRESMVEFTYSDGTKATNFKYDSHVIYKGKKGLEGLPSTYVEDIDEAETLEISMIDKDRKVKAILSYVIYKERPVLTKSVKYINLSEETITLNKVLSACLDLPDSDYELLQLPGAWAKEKQLKRNKLTMGIHTLDSKRGASGVAQQPFMALLAPGTTENSGEVRAFHFVYSGNFMIKVEVDPFEQTRVLVGINTFNFSWELGKNECFQTPEVVFVFSNAGLNGMSRAFHRLYTERLARGNFRFQERPILINNWETTYFDFDEEKLLNLVKGANKLGVELFVLDDGWFGERDSDTTSLGDWIENKRKLPNGLKGLSNEVRNEGLKFGLWFEPEMISEKSNLFRRHPDWHIKVENYPLSQGRNQLILDFSRQEVREYIYHQMTRILDNVPIDYIKWDMNRNMTEVGSFGRAPSNQMETPHRYILGLYEILDKLTKRYPNILFENCSGGGGRFDPGMVYYMPQSWTSDNTDAIERLRIQYSTSLIFPPVMMCAQLSESPNHQVGRKTEVETRADVATSGNFGLTINLERESEADLAKIKQYITWYKKYRKVIQFGEFYRLINPYEKNYGSWMFVNKEKSIAILFFFQILSHASKPWVKVKLEGLNARALYNVEGKILSGDELMKFGFYINQDMDKDFQSKRIVINKIDEI